MKSNYVKTPIGFLPDDWFVDQLDSVATIIMGQSPKSESYNDNKDGLPLVQGNADCTNRRTAPRVYTSQITKVCEIDDVIMTVRAPVGAISRSQHKACIGRGVCALRSNNDYNSDFLYQYMISFEDKWASLSQGSTFTAVNSKDIKSVNVPVPPLPEQKKIAKILSTVDGHIDEVDGMIADLKELKKGLMQKLLTEGIGHKEFKDSAVGRVPVEWEVKTLGEVFKLASGKFLSAKNMVDGDFEVYGGNGISGYHNEFLFKDSKLIIGRVGAKCGCVHKTTPNCWITDNALYISDALIKFNNDFMFNLLTWLDLNKFASQNAQPVISGKKIYNIKVAVPSMDEQNRIADIIGCMGKRIDEYNTELVDLIEFKKGLMQQLLTGKTRVKIDG